MELEKKEWLLVLFGVVIVFLIFFTGYYSRGSDLEQVQEACNEYCFHRADKSGSREVGYNFNGDCICSDGSTGWFNEV